MKVSIAALLLLGVISSTQAYNNEETSLVQIQAKEAQYLAESSESESESEDELVQVSEPCVYLDETKDELDYQVDMFSRTLDPRHWTNVVNISKAIEKKTGKAPQLQVHTWELYDKSFAFPRVRRYEFVQENLDMLEHFQDNLNLNISNAVNMANFLRVANTVRKNINEKYHDGEFDDPANHDPREEAEADPTW